MGSEMLLISPLLIRIQESPCWPRTCGLLLGFRADLGFLFDEEAFQDQPDELT